MAAEILQDYPERWNKKESQTGVAFQSKTTGQSENAKIDGQIKNQQYKT